MHDKTNLKVWWDTTTPTEKVQKAPQLAHFNADYLHQRWADLPTHVQEHLVLLVGKVKEEVQDEG